MSEIAAGRRPARRAAIAEKVVGFSTSDLRAPFLLRLGAMLIDYIMLTILPVLGLISAKVFGDLDIVTDQTLWLYSVLILLLNVVLIPILGGRSLGKILTGLRVVNIDGTEPRRSTIVLRQTAGYLLTLLTAGLGFLISAVNSNGRTLHDLISGTIVVRGSRRIA